MDNAEDVPYYFYRGRRGFCVGGHQDVSSAWLGGQPAAGAEGLQEGVGGAWRS